MADRIILVMSQETADIVSGVLNDHIETLESAECNRPDLLLAMDDMCARLRRVVSQIQEPTA